MQTITINQLKQSNENPLAEGDKFIVKQTNIEGSNLEISLTLGADVCSWKSVTLTGGDVVDGVSDIWIARLELEDPCKGPISFTVNEQALVSGGIFLGKMDESGKRPSNNYYIPVAPKGGTRLDLVWIADA